MKLDRSRLKAILIIFALGVVYYIETQTLGWMVRCPLNLLTGLKCPLCGITTACIALIQGDLHTALHANIGLTVGAPVLLVYFGAYLWRWLYHKPTDGRWMTLCGKIILVLACIWGVARNFLHL